MTVLGEHLYSTPAVAVRELVQNAHDSITRRRIEDPSFDGRPDRRARRPGDRHADRPRRRRGHDPRRDRPLPRHRRRRLHARAARARPVAGRADRPVRARLPLGVHHRRAHDRAHRLLPGARRGARVPQHDRRALQRRRRATARRRHRGRAAADATATASSPTPPRCEATVRRYCALLGVPVHVNGDPRQRRAAALARGARSGDRSIRSSAASARWRSPSAWTPRSARCARSRSTRGGVARPAVGPGRADLRLLGQPPAVGLRARHAARRRRARPAAALGGVRLRRDRVRVS